MEAGRLDEARSAFSQLLDLAEHFGDYYLMATITLNMGNLEWRLADFASSERYLEESRSIFLLLGVINGVAECHKLKGIVFFLQEKYRDAYGEYAKSIELNEKTNEMQQAWHGYFNLTEVCIKLGLMQEAKGWWNKGMESFSEKDNPALHREYLELGKQLK